MKSPETPRRGGAFRVLEWLAVGLAALSTVQGVTALVRGQVRVGLWYLVLPTVLFVAILGKRRRAAGPHIVEMKGRRRKAFPGEVPAAVGLVGFGYVSCAYGLWRASEADMPPEKRYVGLFLVAACGVLTTVVLIKIVRSFYPPFSNSDDVTADDTRTERLDPQVTGKPGHQTALPAAPKPPWSVGTPAAFDPLALVHRLPQPPPWADGSRVPQTRE